jgi:hypothetical protein
MNCLQPGLLSIISFCFIAISALQAFAEEKVFSFDDQYIQIEAGVFAGASKSVFEIEVRMTPKPGWKLLAGNSSSIKPLRLKFSSSKCMKLKGAMQSSPPDLSGTDDSGSYSEYFTKAASLRQEFSRLNCTQKKGLEGIATLTYLLCQDNRCVGPFTREIRFKALDKK